MLGSPRSEKAAPGSYDYIVVGGGTSGCIVASGLARNQKAKVLLIEAGPADNRCQLRMPAAFGVDRYMRPYKWDYSTEPEAGLKGRSIPIRMGRVLGGSSSVNGMMYVRGGRADFDGWSEYGVHGWSFDDVLPVYRQIENHCSRSGQFHGRNGEIKISEPGWEKDNGLNAAFVAAGMQLGLPFNKDFNGESNEGIGYYDRTLYDGFRQSSASAFLRDVASVCNLTVLTNASVSGIELKGKRAIGVTFTSRGQINKAHATREIIICAGAIATPQILLLSGIGPAEHLKAKGISVKHNLLGVGENLQNHPNLHLTFQTSTGSLNSKVRGVGKMFAGLQWLLHHKGPAASNHFSAGAFVRSGPRKDRPDLQYCFLPFALDENGHPISGHGFQINVGLIRPSSRGSIRLRSSNADAKPEIVFNYLQEPMDVTAMENGVNIARKIAAQGEFSKYRVAELRPGKSLTDHAELRCWIQSSVNTSHHVAGTCRLGSMSDPLSVVDSELRVLGVSGLRIADASVLPRITAGNTCAPAMMIGQRASNLIAEENG